ncbi:MAG: TatD family hydrolase [Muribaculaceae bacterium]|nr:TatD family hydrolase [Muribaculaceae bacterium]
MVDTHTHLYMDSFSKEEANGCAAAVDRAFYAGVELMVLPAVDRESAAEVVALHTARPTCTRTAMGLHPTEVGEDWREEIDDIVTILTPTDPVAIGEVGIDLYWDDSNLSLQKEAFIAQILIAQEKDLPVIIHCRDGVEVCCECIEEAKRRIEAKTAGGSMPPLVFHSFTGSPDDVRRIREICDPFFGINGVVTFKNSGQLPEAVKEIGIARILLETDSPYLAPGPKRGRRNESSYLTFINNKVAEILRLSPEETDRLTTRNAKHFFRI